MLFGKINNFLTIFICIQFHPFVISITIRSIPSKFPSGNDIYIYAIRVFLYVNTLVFTHNILTSAVLTFPRG